MAAQLDLEQLNNALQAKEKTHEQGREKAQKSPVSSPSPLKNIGGKGKKAENPLNKIPVLDHTFRVEPALEGAYEKAVSYMNQVLNRTDLYVELESVDGKVQGHVFEIDSQKQVNSYSGEQILKLYAQNNFGRGMIINGRV